MRFRVLRTLSALAFSMSAGLVSTAVAQTDGDMAGGSADSVWHDPYQTSNMMGMLHSVASQDPTYSSAKPTFWLDIGAGMPVGTFEERGWTNGFILQLGHEFWSSGLFGINGQLGFFFNEDSRFNERRAEARARQSGAGPLHRRRPGHQLGPGELGLAGLHPHPSAPGPQR